MKDDRHVFNKVFGDRLRRLRIDRKMTQEQLSETLGMLVTQLSHIERGRQAMPIRYLWTASVALGTSIETLLRYDPKMYRGDERDEGELELLYESLRSLEDMDHLLEESNVRRRKREIITAQIISILEQMEEPELELLRGIAEAVDRNAKTYRQAAS